MLYIIDRKYCPICTTVFSFPKNAERKTCSPACQVKLEEKNKVNLENRMKTINQSLIKVNKHPREMFADDECEIV